MVLTDAPLIFWFDVSFFPIKKAAAAA